MDGKGMGKLIPNKVKRKKRQQQQDPGNGTEDVQGGAPISQDDAAAVSSSNPEEEEGTSFVSYESELEDGSSARPNAISTHPSQIGYLTTSSPLVQEAHISESQLSAVQDPAPAGSDAAAPPRALQHSKTSLGLTAPAESQDRRSTSPVGRFRDVFRSRRSSTTNSSPERRPVTAGNSSVSDSNKPPPSLTNKTSEGSSSATESSDAAKLPSSERSRRRSKGHASIDTGKPPRTPPSADQGPPVIVNTPPTPTDHKLPRFPPPARPHTADASDIRPSTAGASSGPGGIITQRRLRSGSGNAPSKLSNITLAPLTPTPENGPAQPSPGSGFFSSMLSAAQNAANTFSNSIQNNNIGSPGNKQRAASSNKDQDAHPDSGVEVVSSTDGLGAEVDPSKELAVKTLGMGDLSLSQLGIVEPPSNSNTPVTSKFPDVADSRARSESAPTDSAPSVTVLAESNLDEPQSASRPRSPHGPASAGDRTPPTGSIYEGKSEIHRSGSIRSAIGKRRKRGSSVATGHTVATIGAAIAAAGASAARPGSITGTPKLTGFAVASKKRNRDFHTLFKSVPDDDYLIEDYSCALQREILAHGRLYVSEGHLCFSSNIFGWITTLVMSFDEIVSVEKKSTALLFKNGLMISTLHAKHVFASFTSRDSTYDLIVKIWKLGHPSLRSSLNGVHIDDAGGGDKTEKVEAEAESVITGHSGSDSVETSDEEEDDDDDVYDEDEENQEAPETTQLTEPGSLETDAEKAVSRKPSGAVVANGTAAEKPNKEVQGAGVALDFPGPATHAPTDCGDADTHYDKVVGDDVIPAPLGKVFNLIFGPASVSFMAKWITTEQKCTDLQMEDKKGLSLDNKTRNYTYIKPLTGSIGPRQTKCVVAEQIDNLDYEKAVNVSVTTQNPDVPSGNVFMVKTKYCLSWAENNSTRVQVNCTIEWTGKSWLKGPIEKGANDGQTLYCKDLFASLKSAVSSRPRSATLNGAQVKGKKRGRKGKSSKSEDAPVAGAAVVSSSAKQDWGLLEPVHGIVGPVVDIVQPLMTGNVVYGLLVGLLVASWFGFGFTPRQSPSRFGPDLGFYGYPDRLAAYEEMWRREESELWDWLEERVGLERLNSNVVLEKRKKAVEPRTVEEKLRGEKMDERDIEEAIRVTEDKLKVLKSVMDKRKEQNAS